MRKLPDSTPFLRFFALELFQLGRRVRFTWTICGSGVALNAEAWRNISFSLRTGWGLPFSMLFLDVMNSCKVRSCAWRWRRVDRKIAPVVGQRFIGCGTVPLVTGARPTAAARQMECIAAALKSPDKSGYSLQRTYALGLAVQGRFD